jgi:hypothetical protein
MLIAASSIMQPTYAASRKTGIPETRVNSAHGRRIAIQLFFEVSLRETTSALLVRARVLRTTPSSISSLRVIISPSILQ